MATFVIVQLLFFLMYATNQVAGVLSSREILAASDPFRVDQHRHAARLGKHVRSASLQCSKVIIVQGRPAIFDAEFLFAWVLKIKPFLGSIMTPVQTHISLDAMLFWESAGFVAVPIGTSCRALQTDNIIHCIDALGTTTLALPSATTGLVPSATPVMGDDQSIVYSPSEAWQVSNTDSTCSVSKSLHVTNTTNASVSYNFTGPSIMVRTITSLNGGVFSVWIDGINTTSNVDTFANPGNTSLPSCYPLQFPPFAVTPPGFETHSNHTITLIYTGPSEFSQDGTPSAVEFDSFAIPDFHSSLTATSSSPPTHIQDFHLLICFLFPISFLYIAF
ncbi:hypothetical protein GALMADRAFT_147196 [Galerina marginata CBS 339.88]|uniref:Uncharacterized protein n=1 Tax=Galerina marginata (strain CBS 339.88) TaxID=685588 RepID=A0A067S9A4_GALM3|nr:hypothetical protein GALMADRAFT_147196 [Galerina marginata CBS 339.88]